MCVIAISGRGARQPDLEELREMYAANPHGAGYMVARGGAVEIHKGFMLFDDLAQALAAERFSATDPVVYHFRISTQAGVNPEMTHPFPLSGDLRNMCALDVRCHVGVAHNGIIRLTSTNDARYSDTALFIARYMSVLIRARADLVNPDKLQALADLTQSKLAIMDGLGRITTVGRFTEQNGILVSNLNHIWKNYIA